MKVGESLRQDSKGGTPGGAIARRLGVAAAGAAAALSVLACVTPPPPPPSEDRKMEAARVMADVEKGGELYASGDFVLAARRFESAAAGARNCGDLAMERKTTAAECTSWLRARRLRRPWRPVSGSWP